MKKVVSLILVVLLFGVGSVMSAVSEKDIDNYKHGMEALKENNFSNAYKYFKKSKKYAEAQFELGNLYANGNGVKQNDKDAIYWYEKAEAQGLGKATFCLGKMYGKQAVKATGKKISEKKSLEEKAVEYYKKSAEGGYAEAQCYLGDLYYGGIFVKQDKELAYEWYNKASIKKDKKAQYRLAKMFESGDSVIKNQNKAIQLYKKSANLGYDKAQYELGNYYYSKGNHKAAVRYYSDAAEQGNADAQYELGCMYSSGDSVEANFETAFDYFRKAESSGNEDAIYMLGDMYYSGLGRNEDKAKAFECYKNYAELKNDLDAQYKVGYMYSKGEGVGQDINEARKWFELAAKQGHKDAQTILKSL